MGMYTGLRGTVIIKEQYRGRMESMINGDGDPSWAKSFGDIDEEFIQQYIGLDRADFIPHGAVCYMPEFWCDNDGGCGFDENLGIFTFNCSLKNYSDEIGSFLRMLRVIADNWEIQELYEENDYLVDHSYRKVSLEDE